MNSLVHSAASGSIPVEDGASVADTISDRLARYGVTHQAAGANGRYLSFRGRGMGYAHSDQAVVLLELLDSLSASRAVEGGK